MAPGSLSRIVPTGTGDKRGLTEDSLTGAARPPNTSVMLGSILTHLSPYARVLTAVMPFLLAIAIRCIYGKNRVTQVLLSISTMWFAVNILLAPYSAGMQRDLAQVRAWFR
jgi:hypothetical protein